MAAVLDPQAAAAPRLTAGCDQEALLGSVVSGQRLAPAQALYLLEHGDPLKIGRAADAIRRRRFPDERATYIIDRNINYTNVCVARCSFCAFYRPPGHEESYLRPMDEIFRRIDEALAQSATQIMFQGGHDPKLRIDYYEHLFSQVKQRYGPQLTLHSLTPSEVIHISKLSRIPLRETLLRLRAAGLDSLPGGGAELLVDRVRKIVSPYKNSAARWLEVMETAHELGIRTTATMMFGMVETLAERIEHLAVIREVQDRAPAGQGFRAFIPWTYQSEHTELGARGVKSTVSGMEYLKLLAISRLFYDNIEHVQGSWLTVGKAVGRMSLQFGADDLGSIMLEENVVSAAGVQEHCLLQEEMIELIQETGRRAARRNTSYEILDWHN